MSAQALMWAGLDNSRRDTAEAKGAELRRMMKAYSYVDVLTSWDGWHGDRPGVWWVLEGSPRAIVDTVQRLASGLVFVVPVRWDLNTQTLDGSGEELLDGLLQAERRWK